MVAWKCSSARFCRKYTLRNARSERLSGYVVSRLYHNFKGPFQRLDGFAVRVLSFHSVTGGREIYIVIECQMLVHSLVGEYLR